MQLSSHWFESRSLPHTKTEELIDTVWPSSVSKMYPHKKKVGLNHLLILGELLSYPAQG